MKPINRIIRRWRLWRLRRAVLAYEHALNHRQRRGLLKPSCSFALVLLGMSADLPFGPDLRRRWRKYRPRLEPLLFGKSTPERQRALRRQKRMLEHVDDCWRAYVRSLRYLAGGR